MFKRLWWQGYRGRVGCFQWPTLTTSTGLTTYDQSEHRAWRSGKALAHRIDRLNSAYPNQVRVIAHSMGNVVMGETLRLLASPVVHSYISAQSAIPAHSYDNTIPVPSDWTWLTTPDVMGHYYSGQNDTSYLNGVQAKVQDGRLFNYFNPRDFALNLWEEGNKRKPDSYAHGYNYHEGDQNRETYKPNTGNPLTDDYFYHFDGALDHLRRMRFPEEPSSQTDDRFEIFARCAQSRSRTVGALSMVQGFISMPLVRYEFNSRHLGHSKEFRSDIVAEKGFWEQAAKDFELHWNVTNQP